ncbi:Uncharacterised protein [Vibrio cholerae]|uniref:Uncharacterized protein n=1 Tax=Vibrio cholerae TaxID=666 RepID=A0A655Q3G8_VIBCL|nr:Uncharacterised protein [Vibrio cholerae]CSB27682.1 Uncharacterised protein [Vibrio cholerae]CSC78557.1 Uncharacterised protein [Vibrio cholerae]CSC85982.1 Uncharacterised protein [Vibrio cholerae]CSC88341.1 Uncharacterised protein [Vibrio cholerae]
MTIRATQIEIDSTSTTWRNKSRSPTVKSILLLFSLMSGFCVSWSISEPAIKACSPPLLVNARSVVCLSSATVYYPSYTGIFISSLYASTSLLRT